ncbi:MAG: STAS domain-containing protein [Treponema sp.]|jgi:anti-sigma B factor antagonist|nr:STAS domain-containing protein [Treponema sp.]
MEVTKIQAGDKLILKINGKLSAATAEAFNCEVEEAIAESSRIEMDFTEVSYMASAGLRVLIAAQKKLNVCDGLLTLRNVREDVLEVFKLTGLDEVFDIQ